MSVSPLFTAPPRAQAAAILGVALQAAEQVAKLAEEPRDATFRALGEFADGYLAQVAAPAVLTTGAVVRLIVDVKGIGESVHELG